MNTTNRGRLARWLALSVFTATAASAQAASVEWDGLSIAKIRAVGDYGGSDTTYDNTIEIWLANPPALPAGVTCSANFRVYINANNKHLVAAAYLAMATGKKVNLNLDDSSLPIRGGACEASFVDVVN